MTMGLSASGGITATRMSSRKSTTIVSNVINVVIAVPSRTDCSLFRQGDRDRDLSTPSRSKTDALLLSAATRATQRPLREFLKAGSLRFSWKSSSIESRCMSSLDHLFSLLPIRIATSSRLIRRQRTCENTYARLPSIVCACILDLSSISCGKVSERSVPWRILQKHESTHCMSLLAFRQ